MAMRATKSTDQAGRTDDGLRRGTGKGRDEWYAELDAWGAVGRSYPEIAGWLTEHGMSRWWAQKTIVEYEQARGVRGAGARRGGTFDASASKTIAAPRERIREALGPDRRAGWLPDLVLTERPSRDPDRLGFDLPDGSRLRIRIGAKPDGRAQVSVEQERIADAATAAQAREAWRERLETLRASVEG
jgi:hypothetical protein